MNKNFISVFLLMLAMGVSVMAQSYEEDLAFFKERVKTLGSDEFGGRTVSYTHLTLPTTERV